MSDQTKVSYTNISYLVSNKSKCKLGHHYRNNQKDGEVISNWVCINCGRKL